MKASNFDARIIWIPPIILTLLFVGMYYLRYRNYIPVSDDISQLGATLDVSFAQWISEGFSKYTIIYPEWYTPITNLARPVINIIFYIQYLLFARHFAFYFVLFYVLQLCSALIIIYFMRVASVRPTISVLFLLLFLFNPAFINYGLVLLSFQLDLFASAFLLIAFFALWKGQHLAAVLMLTLAVFIKEALFAPVAAAISLVIWRRSYWLAALMLVPLFLWILQRQAVFGAMAAGNYAVANGLWGAVTGLVKGVMIWPTGVIPGAGMFSLLRGGPASLTFYAAMIACNVLLWGVLIYSSVIITKRMISTDRQPLDKRFKLFFGLYIWAMGALAFCVLLGLGYARYGASVYGFLLPFLAIMFFGNVVSFPLRHAAKLIVVLLVIASVGHAVKFFSVDFRDADTSNLQQRALYDTLRSLPLGEKRVYVVNAPGGIGAAPNYLASAWQIVPDVTFINQVSGCLTSANTGNGLRLSPNGMLEVRIPDCASFKFQNADPVILAHGVNSELQRAGIGVYRFPYGRIDGYWFQDPEVPILEFGTLMLVKLEDPAMTILAYDWAEGQYKPFEREKSR